MSTDPDQLAEKPVAYTITLRPLTSAAPVEVRLRRALKVLLKEFALKCIAVAEMTSPETKENQRKPKGGQPAAAKPAVQAFPAEREHQCATESELQKVSVSPAHQGKIETVAKKIESIEIQGPKPSVPASHQCDLQASARSAAANENLVKLVIGGRRTIVSVSRLETRENRKKPGKTETTQPAEQRGSR